MQIEVDFDVWRRLTALRRSESDSYSDVIARAIDGTDRADMLPKQEGKRSEGGVALKGVWYPDGTEMRATYKGRTYFLDVRQGALVDRASGQVRNSPSSAASAITGSSANGRTFWFARRPGESAHKQLAKQ